MLELIVRCLTWNTAFTFNELDVFSCVFRKFFPGFAARDVGLPAGYFYVLDLCLVQDRQVSREGFERLAIDQVGCGNLDDRQLVQDIELGDVKTSVAIDHAGILDNNQIEPAASSLSSGSDTELETNTLEILASFLIKHDCQPFRGIFKTAIQLTLSCSVGNGPPPTRVVYALTTPMIFLMLVGGTPRPVQTPPTAVLEEVT